MDDLVILSKESWCSGPSDSSHSGDGQYGVHLSVQTPAFPHSDENGSSKKLQLSLTVQGLDCRVECIGNPAEMRLATNDRQNWRQFLNQQLRHFAALVCAALEGTAGERFLWVQGATDNAVWILGLECEAPDGWHGMLQKCPRPRVCDLDTGFHSSVSQKCEMTAKAAATRLYESFTTRLGLPAEFPLLRKANPQMEGGGRLTVKVHSDEPWFLCYPIDYFCVSQEFGSFGLSTEVEWILSDHKTFLGNAFDREVLSEELRDIPRFLKHGVIVMNEYPRQTDLSGDMLKLLKCHVLPLLQKVQFSGKSHSLRCYLNPSAEEVIKMITTIDGDATHYFFANFHVENGVWSCGGGHPEPIRLPDESSSRQLLSHIRLMRIFHCQSVAIATTLKISPSIVQRLLTSGANRVEGAIINELSSDYFASLLQMLFTNAALQFILLLQCRSRGIDFSALAEQAKTLLASAGPHWTSSVATIKSLIERS